MRIQIHLILGGNPKDWSSCDGVLWRSCRNLLNYTPGRFVVIRATPELGQLELKKEEKEKKEKSNWVIGGRVLKGECNRCHENQRYLQLPQEGTTNLSRFWLVIIN